MAEGKIVPCPRCGKKYKLKEGFEAASFACRECGATVPVKEKEPQLESTRSRTGGRRKARAGKRSRAARGRAKVEPTRARGRGRRRGRGGREEPEEEEGRRRGRYQSQQNSTNVVIAVVGLLLVAGLAVFLVVSGKDDEPRTTTEGREEGGAAERGASGAETGGAEETSGGAALDGPLEGEEKPAKDPEGGDEDGGSPGEEEGGDGSEASEKEDESGGATDPDEPARTMGGAKRDATTGVRRSKWHPSTDIPHLESTPPELRQKIDQLVETMFDVDAGKDSLRAKDKLVAIGKPAFPRILARMAQTRDKLKDDRSLEERLMHSSLKLADQALREMDGYLNAKGVGALTVGTEKKYVEYILILHNRRWVRKLSKMDKMPGPYDPSVEYARDDDDEPIEPPR